MLLDQGLSAEERARLDADLARHRATLEAARAPLLAAERALAEAQRIAGAITEALGGCGIWAVIDCVMTGMGLMKDAQGNSLAKT